MRIKKVLSIPNEINSSIIYAVKNSQNLVDMYFPDINGSTLYKLKSLNSSEITTPYARMFVLNELPSAPQGNELVYLQNSNELYKYDVFENK